VTAGEVAQPAQPGSDGMVFQTEADPTSLL
jgi:hypothetical protein